MYCTVKRFEAFDRVVWGCGVGEGVRLASLSQGADGEGHIGYIFWMPAILDMEGHALEGLAWN